MLSILARLLHQFGRVAEPYSGSGSVRFASGTTHPVEFAAAQLADGRNVFLCGYREQDSLSAVGDILSTRPPEDFSGRTIRGSQLQTHGKSWPVSFPGEMKAARGFGAVAAYTPQRMTHWVRNGTPTDIRYGLTNVYPPGRPRLPIRLQACHGWVDAALVRLPDYKTIFETVRFSRSVAVTCELVVPADSGSTAELQQLVDDVSFLLSVAQGCKVQWTYRAEYDQQGILSIEHCDRKTHPYGPLAVIDQRSISGPKAFLEATYPVYVRIRQNWHLNSGLIDAYLEAKAEADYLETRAAKLSVALEALKHRYLRSGETSTSEFLVDPPLYSAIEPDLRKIVRRTLEGKGIPTESAKAMVGKLPGLNRESFSQILKSLASDLGLQLASSERRSVVDSRNTLVHQGQFYCQAVAKGEATGSLKPLSSPVTEYLFMVSVLDRIFLKLLGYSGEYTDWAVPGGPVAKHLQ